jgi:hypothetical protein
MVHQVRIIQYQILQQSLEYVRVSIMVVMVRNGESNKQIQVLLNIIYIIHLVRHLTFVMQKIIITHQ